MKYFFLVLLAFSSQAAPKETLMKMKVTYGEKISSFEVTKENKKFYGSFTSAEGTRQRELKKEDVDHLLAKFKGEKSRKEGSCPRQLMEVEVGKNKLASCIGGSTELSKKLTKIADLLSTAI